MQDRRFPGQQAQGITQTQTGTSLDASAASVLKNTYMLLGLTLAFSAAVAYFSMNMPHPGFIITLVGFYGLLFLTSKLQNSIWGIASTFALTGFMGYTLGPIIGMYAGAGAMGIVTDALGLTALVFFGLSAYSLITKKDFSFLNGFVMVGFFVLIGATVLSLFTEIAGLHLAISCGFVLFSSAIILMQTGSIINGGERNYIMATVTLYVSLYNLFLSLLNILTALGGDD